jgi:SMI1 / KNR4 family (SUKH-1)
VSDELTKVREFAATWELPPPASPQEVSEIESTTGLRLPPFLREVYLSVANGCFGPGYGLMPLIRHPIDEAEETVLGVYDSFRQPDPDDPAWAWPKNLLPICDWGCAIRSCVDCSSGIGPVVRFDPNGHGPGVEWESAFEAESPSITAWLVGWASGTLRFDL